MSESVKAIPAQEFPTPAIAEKAKAALVAYREIKAGLRSLKPQPGAVEMRPEDCQDGDLEAMTAWVGRWVLVKDLRHSVLMHAIMQDHRESVRLLIERGADIHAFNNEAFKSAAKDGRTEIFRLLLEHNADPTKEIFEAIMDAAGGGHTEILRMLFERDAIDPENCNRAFQRASENGHLETVRFLLGHGADAAKWHNVAIGSAAFAGRIELVRLLIAHGADVTDRLDFALRAAAMAGRTAVAALLIENGANATAGYDSALIDAARNGYTETVRLLIAHGANARVCESACVLEAASNGHIGTACLLIDHGADENVLFERHKKQVAQYRVQEARWRQVLRRDPLPYVWREDPALFKGTCYESVCRMLAAEGLAGEEASIMAFHAAALFQTEGRVLQYLKQWGGPEQQALHNLVQMIKVPSALPDGIKPNMKDWADGVLKCGPSMAKLAKFADKVPSPAKTDDGRTWSMVKTREECARFRFTRAEENLALAALCFEHSAGERTFDQALTIVKDKRPLTKNIPEVAFDGGSFEMPGGKFRRLADGDIKGLFLGEMTNCCQSIGGAGAACARHGFTSAESGFYVVENAKGRIVGQSWAWRGKKGELCLDSLETLGRNVTGEQWLGIIEAFRAALSNGNEHKVTALTIGMDGATRDSCPGLTEKFTEAACAVPKDYNGYRDSHKQRFVWRAPDV